MKKAPEILTIVLLCVATVLLIPLQMSLGWVVGLLGIITTFFCRKQFAQYLVLLHVSVAILGFTPITTDISYSHMISMGLALSLALMIPYLASRFIYKDGLVRFTFHHGRAWYRIEIMYIAVAAVISYVLLPFFLRDTGSYRNWSVEPGVSNIIRLFIGTNALGIWDELFFVSTVLGILRRFMRFSLANLVQAVMFTAFLYELGFRGWGGIMIFCFALIQGYIFKKTESLFYVITIHLVLDFILFWALIEVHHPEWIHVFIL